MSEARNNALTVLVVGGGIGGLACALVLARLGLRVRVIEQSETIGEIGAGIQLGPNAFAALEALGIGENARGRAVFTEELVLMDAMDASVVARVPTGAAFREHFGNPYAVIHRADIHEAIFDSIKASPLVEFVTGTRAARIDTTSQGVAVIDETGRTHHGVALIGCDGVRSVVRQALIGDPPRVSGHVVYRAVVPTSDMPEDLCLNAPTVWAGPNYHLVHYPLRGGKQYNLVVTFHSRDPETWGVREGNQEEVLSYFTEIHEKPRRLLDKPSSWKRWSTADRDPVAQWSHGPVTLLGDAAHPMLQYLAQGACMALEDAVTLGAALKECEFDFVEAFKLYEQSRITRTARVVLSAREMGRVYHAKGVERLIRNGLWQGRTAQGYYDALQWLYGWRAENCLSSQ